MSGRPTGQQRRRSRRVPPLVHELEPDVELYEHADGTGEPLCAPQSDETDPGGMGTADSDQDERTAHWHEARAAAHALMADVDAVLAAFDRETARTELDARLRLEQSAADVG